MKDNWNTLHQYEVTEVKVKVKTHALNKHLSTSLIAEREIWFA